MPVYWRGASKSEYVKEEKKDKTIIKTLDYDGNGLRVNKWIVPIDDPYFLKMNLIKNRENCYKEWMDRYGTLGYRYCNDLRDKEYQLELQILIAKMVMGYLRRTDVIIIIPIQRMIIEYCKCRLAIFREFQVFESKAKSKSMGKYYKRCQTSNNWDNDWKTKCQCKWTTCEKDDDGIYRVKKISGGVMEFI